MTAEETVELEKLIDRTSLSDVLDALEQIAYEKAEHLRSNWQDEITARAWEKAARAINKAQSAALDV